MPVIYSYNAVGLQVRPTRLAISGYAMGASVSGIIDNNQTSASTYEITYPTSTSVKTIFTLALGAAVGTHMSFGVGLEISGGSNYQGYKFQIATPIEKTNLQVMTYIITMSWGRYTGA
ncbi:hypothetical protein D3C80_1006670 [compost metagenome]